MPGDNENEPHVASDFTAEDQAMLDAMRNGDGPAPVDEGGDGEGDSDEQVLETASDEGDDDHDGDEPVEAKDKDASDDSIPPSKRPPISYWKHQKQIKKLKEENARLLADFDGTKLQKAKAEERLALIVEAINTKQAEAAKPAPVVAEAPVIPDPEEDPIGYMKYQATEIQRLNDRLSKGETQTQQSHQEKEVTDFYMTDAKTFAAQQPDFGPAYQDLMIKRMALYAVNEFGKDVYSNDAGDKLTPTEIAKINKLVAQEEQQVVMAAINQKQSPAQRIYKLALANGYRPAPPQAAAQVTGKSPSTAAAPAPAAAPTVSDALKNIRAGKEASASLSDAGGSPGSNLDVNQLLKMGDDEFGAMLDSLPAHQLDALMGK